MFKRSLQAREAQVRCFTLAMFKLFFMMRLLWNIDLSKVADGPVSDSVAPKPIDCIHAYAKPRCDNLSFDVIRDLSNGVGSGSESQAKRVISSFLALM